jgi:hypothetical protein
MGGASIGEGVSLRTCLATVSSFSVRNTSTWQGLDMYGLMRPWARYVRRRCFCAWFTWMCSITRLSTSSPLTCNSHPHTHTHTRTHGCEKERARPMAKWLHVQTGLGNPSPTA